MGWRVRLIQRERDPRFFTGPLGELRIFHVIELPGVRFGQHRAGSGIPAVRRDDRRKHIDRAIDVCLFVVAIEQRPRLPERSAGPIAQDQCRRCEDEHADRGGDPAPSPPRLPPEADRACCPGRRVLAEVAKISRQVLGRGVAIRRILREAPLDNRDNLDRGIRSKFADRIRLGVDGRRHRLHRRIALEGAPAGEHFIHDRAKRELIGPEIGRLVRHLLGRHVSGRAEDNQRLGEPTGMNRRIVRAVCRMACLADAEVDDLRAAVFRQHDVPRLQIAVHDAGRVRDGQPVGDLARDVERTRQLQPLPLKCREQRLAGDQFHHDVRVAIQLADVVDGDDIRVVEERRHPRFAATDVPTRGGRPRARPRRT